MWGDEAIYCRQGWPLAVTADRPPLHRTLRRRQARAALRVRAEIDMRRAARQDINHHELVEALKKIGAKCYYIKEPVDLVVGFRGRSILLELTRPGKPLTLEGEESTAAWA